MKQIEVQPKSTANPVIGFDIGGTHLRVARYQEGELRDYAVHKTPLNHNQLTVLLQHLAAERNGGKRDFCIGISVAGVVRRSVLNTSPNAPYLTGYDFKTAFPNQPLVVDNDARAFLRAALFKGYGQGASCVLALTIGTGLGRALARAGRVAKVKRLEYPEAWEHDYQHLRRSAQLEHYLALQFRPLILHYQPNLIILGGGVPEQRLNFYKKFQHNLKPLTQISVIKPRDSVSLGCLGAGLEAMLE